MINIKQTTYSLQTVERILFRDKKAMPGRNKKDEKEADFIEINPYGDMICTFIFLAEIAALLWHAKVTVAIFLLTTHAQANLVSNKS